MMSMYDIPDGVWVPYKLPWVEGRCIPESRWTFNKETGKWEHMYSYPIPINDKDNEDTEEEDSEESEAWDSDQRCFDLNEGGNNMNGKQAARKAAKWIERLEDYNLRASAEIKHLNLCIDSVIAGERTFCSWCEEHEECQLKAKETGAGCDQWWLKIDFPEDQEKEDAADDSQGILSAGPTCGE
jgi:hypothetical protein